VTKPDTNASELPVWVLHDEQSGVVSFLEDTKGTPKDPSDDFVRAQGFIAGQTVEQRRQNFQQLESDEKEKGLHPIDNPLLSKIQWFNDAVPRDASADKPGARTQSDRATQDAPATSQSGTGRAPGQAPGEARVAPPSSDDRGRFVEPAAEEPERDPDAFQIDLPEVVVGAGMAIAMTAVGVALAAFSLKLAIAAAAALVGYGVYNGLRAAAESGNEEGAVGRIIAKSVGDVMPINPIEIGEAFFGFDYVSGAQLDNHTRNERLGSSLGGFSAGAAMGASHRAHGLREAFGRHLDRIRQDTERTLRAIYEEPKRGYVTVGSSQSKRLEQKIGKRADEVVYSSGRFDIASDRYLKDMKRGQGTGMDSNHLALAEWFRKGPANTQGVEHYVPAYLLMNGMEHQGTFHGAFNEHMRQHGLFQKPSYSKADIERALTLAEKFYRNNPGGDLGKAWADAVAKFRREVYSKVK
jgi:hypothetical protein